LVKAIVSRGADKDKEFVERKLVISRQPAMTKKTQDPWDIRPLRIAGKVAGIGLGLHRAIGMIGGASVTCVSSPARFMVLPQGEFSETATATRNSYDERLEGFGHQYPPQTCTDGGWSKTKP
jgi:hypothetical protein